VEIRGNQGHFSYCLESTVTKIVNSGTWPEYVTRDSGFVIRKQKRHKGNQPNSASNLLLANVSRNSIKHHWSCTLQKEHW